MHRIVQQRHNGRKGDRRCSHRDSGMACTLMPSSFTEAKGGSRKAKEKGQFKGKGKGKGPNMAYLDMLPALNSVQPQYSQSSYGSGYDGGWSLEEWPAPDQAGYCMLLEKAPKKCDDVGFKRQGRKGAATFKKKHEFDGSLHQGMTHVNRFEALRESSEGHEGGSSERKVLGLLEGRRREEQSQRKAVEATKSNPGGAQKRRERAKTRFTNGFGGNNVCGEAERCGCEATKPADGKQARPLNILLGACDQKAASGWKVLSMAVGSGACATVANPKEIPGYPVHDTEGSLAGENFTGAGGEEIENMGGMSVPIYTREQTMRQLNIVAAPVTKPLLSVKQLNKTGHVVIFDGADSCIINKHSGEISYLREEGGNFMLDVAVPPNDGLRVFPRQP